MDTTNENALAERAELQPVQTPAGDQPPVSGKFTYPDGCEVFGAPDFDKYPGTGFPEKSPREVQAQVLRDESADLIAQQQAVAIRAAREEEAAKIAAAAAAARELPAGIVTADQVQQVPTDTSDTSAA